MAATLSADALVAGDASRCRKRRAPAPTSNLEGDYESAGPAHEVWVLTTPMAPCRENSPPRGAKGLMWGVRNSHVWAESGEEQVALKRKYVGRSGGKMCRGDSIEFGTSAVIAISSCEGIYVNHRLCPETSFHNDIGFDIVCSGGLPKLGAVLHERRTENMLHHSHT